LILVFDFLRLFGCITDMEWKDRRHSACGALVLADSSEETGRKSSSVITDNVIRFQQTTEGDGHRGKSTYFA
jgi:hypothetical protein